MLLKNLKGKGKGKETAYYTFIRYPQIIHYVDLLFCLVILPLIILLVPVDKWIKTQPVFVGTLVLYLYLLYFTYRKANIPSLFLKRKYLHIIILIIILTLITELLTHFPISDKFGSKLPIDFRRHLHSQTIWFFFLIVSGFSLAIEVTFELFRQMLQKQEIEAEKNKAELAMYKAQINPHFLFNTLNTLYGLVITKSDLTESAFVKFSNILKYMYDNTSVEKIDINNEIEYIRQYVELQKLRLNHHTKVIFESRTDEEHVLIPPMILITFVENAFKYGTSSSEDCTILIRIIVEDGVLLFKTRNSIMKEKKEGESSIGIENCRKRLQLLYPGLFTLITEKDNNKQEFLTKLTIQLSRT
ncbi:sensor histidine kinase [uncultured Coprobacter sp.]|uniref:sensor histidine kinase n=1 Tax=uncultured Coprobacter sp. TaxID=1720550 RepID=UPI00260985B0|nr:histidine kinase [uncultured Coprobacter sp.]